MILPELLTMVIVCSRAAMTIQLKSYGLSSIMSACLAVRRWKE